MARTLLPLWRVIYVSRLRLVALLTYIALLGSTLSAKDSHIAPHFQPQSAEVSKDCHTLMPLCCSV